ncbi:MAG TPA: hypothetical protein DEA08_10595 [Planctomycetes bacterium]|nr:hypothetical protein [Planctomycetota bacterium]
MSDAHYDEIAERYEDVLFYDPDSPYHRWLVGRALAHLALSPSHRLADIGGGAGAFALELAAAAELREPVLVVEPSAGLSERAIEREGLVVEALDAEAFARQEGPRLDRILMKEVVHHLDPERLDVLYQGLYARLAPGGRLVTITRPLDPPYPLFAAAREVWRRNQPPAELFADAMGRAGFGLERHDERYPLEVERDTWLAMIGRRFWSTFSAFDDEALAAGIAELRAAHAAGPLRFDDHLIVLVAERL